MPQAEARLRVMDVDAHVEVVGDDAHYFLQRARARLIDLGHRWDRFAEDSEVGRINRAAGSWCLVSPETHLLVRRANDKTLEVADHVGAVRLDPGAVFDPARAGPGVAAELIADELVLRGANAVRVTVGAEVCERTIG
jgi:hypothetical protein